MHSNTNATIWRRARTVGLTSCVLLLILIGAVAASLLRPAPLLYVAIGFGLSVSLRQAALMTFVLLWSWREVRWRMRGVASR